MLFKEYVIKSEESYKEEIKKTLNKLPKSHAALVKGFKFTFQSTNTLSGDSGHVGVINTKNKKITIAAPWNYGREYTLLHEIGHLIFAHFLTPDLVKEWEKIVKSTKMKRGDRQPAEELFSMSYATFYAKNKLSKFEFPEWHKFIAKVPT